MSAQVASAPVRDHGRLALVLAALASVAVFSVAGDLLAAPFLFLGFVLVPGGIVFGVVVRVLLVVRRRRARRAVGPDAPDGAAAVAARGHAPVQVVSRRIDVLLLAMAAAGVANALLSSWLDTARYGFAPLTEAGQAPYEAVHDVLVHIEGGLLFTALVAIPVVLVQLSRRLGDAAVLTGEAWALSRGGAAARRIRLDRALAAAVTLVYGAVAVAAVVEVVTYSPSF